MAITNTANFNYQFRESDYTASASVTIQQEVLPVVTMSKTAHPETVYSGDTVTYFVSIEIAEFTGAMTQQIFSDLIPQELEFVPGTLTIDTEPSEESPTNLSVNWAAGSSHMLVYQCLVL